MRIKQVNEYSGGGYGEVGKGFMDTAAKTLDKTSDLVNNLNKKIQGKPNNKPKTTNKKGDPVTIVGTAGDDELVIQDKTKKKHIVKSAELRIKEAKRKKLIKGTKLKNRYKGLVKKISKAKLKEAKPELFEINFNKKEIGKEALIAPVKCGFEAETFWYNVEGGSSQDIDDMSVSDVEYEYGDLPDQAYEDYREWIYEKAMDDYLPDFIDSWIQDNRDEDEYIQDFMDSGDGPTEDAVEEYKEQFKEDDPNEFENREEDGWDDDNWARDLINEEYEAEYEDFLRDIASEDDQVRDDAVDECEGDHNMDDWINDQWSYMSSFLDDYGFEYRRDGDGVEAVASELYHGWIEKNSKFDEYPDYGEYGSTNNPTGWSVETDSSIDPDEGTGAELISPVFNSPQDMLKEMKSLFEYADGNFGTNNTTGLHITMSWKGEPDAPVMDDGKRRGDEPNKLKMALLLGDEYLLKSFGRLRNSYTKSQYKNLLKYAEEMKRGNNNSFLKLQAELEKGISKDKFSSIHFKNQKDRESGNELIEFRIAGGSDYQTVFDNVFKAVVRYATIMTAGYDDKAFRKDYIQAISRLLRKSQEPDVKDAESRLGNISDPIIDAAKEIASKKDYFDVLQTLELSLGHLQKYNELSEPGADKKWKQSIKDYEKGTGDKMDIVEVEEGEPIRGFIQPDPVAPSKRAPESLEKAQLTFGKALAILARNISDGNARQEPKSKHVGAFRKFAKLINLADKDLENILIRNIDNANYSGTAKENIITLQQGAKEIFKKDIVSTPDFFDARDFDPIAEGLWQFFQTADKNDNIKVDKLAELFVKINPSVDKDDVTRTIKQLGKQRQKNQLYRYLKDSGYGVEVTLLQDGMISDAKAIEELKKFLEPYKGYEHPTAKDHHVNIRSDDDYAQVFQNNLVQRLRARLNYVRELEKTDNDKAIKIKTQLKKIGVDFIESIKPVKNEEFPEIEDRYSISDGSAFLGIRNNAVYERSKERIEELDVDDGSDSIYNFVPTYDDYVFGSMTLDSYYKSKQREPNDYTRQDVKLAIKKRFQGYKKFLDAFDKIFKEEGFVDLQKEISGKNVLDKKNKDFEKNIRDNAKATLNIPSHSWVYLEKDFYETITDENYGDRAAYLENHLEDFSDNANSNKVFVIPAAHWGQANDAYEGLDLIDTFESANNFYHSWRKTGYKKILSQFYRRHNIRFEDLTTGKTFFQAGGDEYSKLMQLGIEITRKGDSRTGMPGQDELVKPEDLVNPISGEPIDRMKSGWWNQADDKEKEAKRFKAFDWSVYPEEMRGIVAKELKGMKDKDGYYSFQVALTRILDLINDGKLDIRLQNENNPSGMAKAAGVEGMKDAASSDVADETNWGNLADYLKIERGVDDQGVNLLKKVYNQYDSDHNWRPKNPNAIGVERWAGAVKTAYEYIKSNYTVSAGNYFRKDAEGNAGDDVSSVYGGGQSSSNDQSGFDVTTDDYEKVREKYRMFNAMMQNGIQLYILQPDVNRLVSFLSNEDNDELFKQAVLNRLIKDQESGQEPNDFQGALARARMDLQNNDIRFNDRVQRDRARMLSRESVFDKFDKLPLEEQLLLVEQSVVLEKWSKKYKDSINCSNPKGFSQKAHCAGKKKTNEEIRPDKPAKSSAEYIELGFDPDSDKVKRAKEYEQWLERQRAKGKDVDESLGDLAYANMKRKNKKQSAEEIEQIMLNSFTRTHGEQKARAMIASIKQRDPQYFVNKAKQQESVQENYGKYYCSTDKKWKYRKGPKQSRKTNERKLSTKEKNKKEKYVKGMKKSKSDFEKRYGKDAKAVMYATATKMAKEQKLNLTVKAKLLKEKMMMTEVDRVKDINDILSKPFPVGNIKLQMKAYIALPVPEMIDAFRDLHATYGPDSCARSIVRHFAKTKMPKKQLDKINLGV